MDSAIETSAFNQGADARLNGVALHHNPYEYDIDRVARSAWQRGWFDVEEHWSEKARWRTKPLPLPV